MKRVLCILLTLCMLVYIYPVSAFAEEDLICSGTCGENVSWRLNSRGTLFITGTGDMLDGDIPPYWSSVYSETIESVYISDGVTSICSYAFKNCTNLSRISIAESVTSVGKYAFYGCNNLAEITIPKDVSSLGEYTFYGCESLSEISIPDGVSSIGDNTFYNCKNLSSVNVPESITSIGSYAFGNCKKLSTITIPDGVTRIGSCAFLGCESLSAIAIPGDVTSIGNKTFYDCKCITEITIPENVTSIGDHAFSGCTGLTSIYFLGNQPTSIYGNTSFSRVVATLYYPINNTTWTHAGDKNYGGGEITWVPTVLNGIIASGKCGNLKWKIDSDGTLTLSGTGALPDYSSQSHAPWNEMRSNIQSVVIEEGITSIGNYAFDLCSSLTSITIPDSVTSIGDDAFAWCSSLTTISMPPRLNEIGDRAFSECVSLRKIRFTEDAPKFGEDVFENVTATAYFPANNNTWTSAVMQNYGGSITWVATCEYGHSSIVDNAVPATCIEAGLTEGSHCSVCGEVLVAQAEVPALGHSLTKTEAKAPTDTEEGNNAYYTCSRCGKIFKDAAGTQETTIEQETIPALLQKNIKLGTHITIILPDDATSNQPLPVGTTIQNDEKVYTVTDACYWRYDAGKDALEIGPGDGTINNMTVAGGIVFRDGSFYRYASSWTVSPSELTMQIGDTYKLNIVVDPMDTYFDIESSNENVIAVTQDGIITAVGCGTATIGLANLGKGGPECTVTVVENLTEPEKPTIPFTDVHENDYFYDAVAWAVENGITKGATDITFDPNGICTRAQVVTFLWRSAGEPEPTSTGNPFLDVAVDQYYYKAVLWAVENGITKGTSSTTFGPNDTCTRAQVVTFLWRAKGEPDVSAENPFADVDADAYYAKAVQWAVNGEVTKGTSDTTFSPADSCKRGQVVTFLYRAKTTD